MIGEPLPPISPQELVNCPTFQFKLYVDEDVRKSNEQVESGDVVAAALRSPVAIDRWIVMLTKMKRDSETQLANYDPKMDTRPPADAVKWRAGVLRFRNGVEDRLAEAKLLKRAAHLDRLRGAIIDHRATVLNDPGQSEVANKALWDQL